MIEETLGLIFELIWDDENDSGNEGNGWKIGGMLPAGAAEHQPSKLSKKRQNSDHVRIKWK